MNFIISIFDFFYQKKKYEFLKKKISGNIDVFFDIGSHHGTTIKEFLEIFSINKIYAFEPSEKNYLKLKKNVEKIRKTKSVDIKIYQSGIGKKEETLLLNEISDLSFSPTNFNLSGSANIPRPTSVSVVNVNFGFLSVVLDIIYS